MYSDELKKLLNNDTLTSASGHSKALLFTKVESLVLDIGNNLFINNQPVLVDDSGGFSESVVLREGINVIMIKSVNQFNKEVTESVSVEARYNIQEVKPGENQVPVESNPHDQMVEEVNPENTGAEGVKLDEAVSEGEVLGVDVTAEKKTTDKKKKK